MDHFQNYTIIIFIILLPSLFFDFFLPSFNPQFEAQIAEDMIAWYDKLCFQCMDAPKKKKEWGIWR